MLTLARLSSLSLHVAGIKTAIKWAKPSHRSGPDSISPVLFLTTGPDPPLLLLNLLSLPMSCVTFLSQWKTSIILPHTKNGSTLDPQNFCSTNRTQVPSRLGDNVVTEQLVNFLTTNNLIISQNGFLGGLLCLALRFDFLNLAAESADSHR